MGPEGREWRCGEASGKRGEMQEVVAGEAGRARSRRDLCVHAVHCLQSRTLWHFLVGLYGQSYGSSSSHLLVTAVSQPGHLFLQG